MQSRREFLKKALKIGVVASGGAALAGVNSATMSQDVVKGKSKKKEVLYHKSQAWQKYYEIAY